MGTISELNRKSGDKIVKGHLRKIVEIYDHEWIILHELMQNAVDAIQNNPDVDDDGRVEVLLDLDSDRVEVRDNGTGFIRDLELLKPGGTGEEKHLRSRSPSKGYQGVGLKAVMYSTDAFYLESETKDDAWTFYVENLHDYIQPDSDSDPEYDIEHHEKEAQASYTKIEASFPEGALSDFVSGIERQYLPSDSQKWSNLYLKEKDQLGEAPVRKYLEHFWGWYFRSHTYLGCYNALLNIPLINPETGDEEYIKPINIEVTFRSASKFGALKGRLGEWFAKTEKSELTFEFPYRAWDYAAVALENDKLQDKYRIAPEIVTRKPNDPEWEKFKPTFQDKLLELKLLPKQKSEGFREKYADIIALLEKPRSRVSADDYRDVIERITDIYLVIGRTAHFERLGIPNRGLRMIASNGTPTAHEIEIRSTSSTWYLQTMHVVVNVDATLNLGKRHLVNPKLVGRVRDFLTACYPKLVGISRLFVKKESPGDVEDELPDVAANRVIAREGVSFRRFPGDESGLVALFTQAIGSLDSEFSVYGYFSKAVYDGKFLWTRDEVKSDSDLKYLEFKLNINDLVKEFEEATHEKEFKEVSAVIVWNRQLEYPGWDIKGISDARREKLERNGVPTDIVEYILEDVYGEFRPLISVPDLLVRLPRVQGEEDAIEEFVQEMG